MKYVFCFLLGITCLSSLFAQKQATRKNYLYYDFAHWSKKGYSVFNLGYERRLGKKIGLQAQTGYFKFKEVPINAYQTSQIYSCTPTGYFHSLIGQFYNCNSAPNAGTATFSYAQNGMWLGLGPKIYINMRNYNFAFVLNPEIQLYGYYKNEIHLQREVKWHLSSVEVATTLETSNSRIFTFNALANLNTGIQAQLGRNVLLELISGISLATMNHYIQPLKSDYNIPKDSKNTPEHPGRYAGRVNLQVKLGFSF
jgi:hypothetical protein